MTDLQEKAMRMALEVFEHLSKGESPAITKGELVYEIHALRTALAQEPDDECIAALRTLDYCHGLKDGWNFCVANDDAGFERAIASTSEAVRILKKQRALAQPEQEPVKEKNT